MSNSDARNKMTPMQMALVITVIGSGISIIRAPLVLVEEAGQWGWITAILSSAVYYSGAYLVIRLMDSFPGKPLVQFLPQLVGKAGVHVFVWVWLAIIIVHECVRIQAFAREITFFLFDRTPLEIVILTLLLGAAYGGVQEWGTLLRLAQLIFFSVLPFLTLFIAFGAINFKAINLFPLMPENPLTVLKAVPKTWQLFSGYELLMVLFPFVTRGTTQLLKYTAGAYLIRTALILIATITTIGVLTAAGVKNAPYATLLTVRLAELPGTFLERLDNFLLLSWLPVAFITVSIYMFCIGNLLAELYRFSDHRPFVIGIIPILFFGSMGLHDLSVADQVQDLSNWLGLFLTFGAIPFLLFLNWLRIRRSHDTPDQSM